MSKMPWFRAYTEMVDDEKLRLLAFEDRWHFVALLCLKGQGVLDSSDPLLLRKVAVKLGVDLRTLEEVARRLSEVGLIDEKTLQPLAWDSRQMKSDTSVERTRAYRQRQKRHSDVTVTAQEEDTDTDKEKDKEEDKHATSFDDSSLPDWLPPDAWALWDRYRTKRGAKAWTNDAKRLSMCKLEKLRAKGHDPTAVIEESIQAGWTGLFPLKLDHAKSPNKKFDPVAFANKDRTKPDTDNYDPDTIIDI